MHIKLLLVLVCSCLCSVDAASQVRIVGRVVNVLDGRTVEIDGGGSHKIKLQLYGVEVPNDDHPLGEIVFDHLKNLTAECDIEARVYGDLGSRQ